MESEKTLMLQQWSITDKQLGDRLVFLKQQRRELNDLIAIIECQRGNIASGIMTGNIERLNRLSECQKSIESQVQKYLKLS